MNIKEAKEHIKHTLQAYFQKDAQGYPLVPLRQQRPILLIGPPGIGKTAIMEQIAGECDAGLVAYTMTHHTRQSAMGLPRIVERKFNGEIVSVTEYTMSEIIASIFQCMEKTGKKKGILFLDEINCVSETLAPVMLQLLQDKTFGNQKIPKDWLIVAAGNPPEYNKSVREFDIATLDRVRRIELEPDLEVWMSYARKRQIHGSIPAYLSGHRDRFYQIRQENGKKQFVTARGWEDLSSILKSYEQMQIPVDDSLIIQYLQEEKTAADFFDFYRIYIKYGQDYRITELLQDRLSGDEQKVICRMAADGSSGERSMVLSLLLSVLDEGMQRYLEKEQIQKQLAESLRQLRTLWKNDSHTGFDEWVEEREKSLQIRIERELIRAQEKRTQEQVLKILRCVEQKGKEEHGTDRAHMETLLEQVCMEKQKACEKEQQNIAQGLEKSFLFLEKSYGAGAEMSLFLSGLTRNDRIRGFIEKNGCPFYTKYEKMILRQEKELAKICRQMQGLKEYKET